jgi:hypothetical protein
MNVDVPHDLFNIVCIPALAETGMIHALESLKSCGTCLHPVLVLILINHSESASVDTKKKNSSIHRLTEEWCRQNSSSHLIFSILPIEELPTKHAGVGLARKIVMDQAVRIFHSIGKNGAITCFDGDCTCSHEYLAELEKLFLDEPSLAGCSIYFEHELDNISDLYHKKGIILYELHLRSFIQGLRFAEYPFAFHTIGSSMAVGSLSYARVGGMNKRKAGEDYYFLHKIMRNGAFRDLNTAMVFPSSRESNRVPFGTGRSMNDWLLGEKKEEWPTYPPECFEDLRRVLINVSGSWNEKTDIGKLPPSFIDYFTTKQIAEIIADCEKNTNEKSSFMRRFFQHMDGSKTLKYLNFCRKEFYGEAQIEKTAKWVLNKRFGVNAGDENPEELLKLLRDQEKRDRFMPN